MQNNKLVETYGGNVIWPHGKSAPIIEENVRAKITAKTSSKAPATYADMAHLTGEILERVRSGEGTMPYTLNTIITPPDQSGEQKTIYVIKAPKGGVNKDKIRVEQTRRVIGNIYFNKYEINIRFKNLEFNTPPIYTSKDIEELQACNSLPRELMNPQLDARDSLRFNKAMGVLRNLKQELEERARKSAANRGQELKPLLEPVLLSPPFIQG